MLPGWRDRSRGLCLPQWSNLRQEMRRRRRGVKRGRGRVRGVECGAGELSTRWSAARGRYPRGRGKLAKKSGVDEGNIFKFLSLLQHNYPEVEA